MNADAANINAPGVRVARVANLRASGARPRTAHADAVARAKALANLRSRKTPAV